MTLEKLIKAQETLEKKTKLLAKYQTKIDSLRSQMAAKGWTDKTRQDMWVPFQTEGWDVWLEWCDLTHEIESAEEGAKNAKAAIEKTILIIAKRQETYRKENAERNQIEQLPEILVQMMTEVSDSFFQSDIARREKYLADRKKMSYEDLSKRYPKTTYSDMVKSDEEIRAAADKDAEYLILNLIGRIEKKIGTVTSWANLYIDGPALNGWIFGTNGNAEVRTIVAGGYNIQRAHYRVLVL